MKVLLVHNEYQLAGGEKAAIQAQVELFKQNEVNFCFYSRDNAEITSYRLAQKAGFFFDTIYSWRTYQEIKALAAAEKPDIAHIHNVFPLISPSIYRALHDRGIPIVQTIHNFRLICPKGVSYRNQAICESCKFGNTLPCVLHKCYHDSRLLSALYALAISLHRRLGTFSLIDRMITLTPFTEKKLVESKVAAPSKFAVLGNFLPDPIPSPDPSIDRENFLLFMGRLSPEKGAHVLVEAAARHPHLQVKIAGTGPQADELHQLARNLNLENISFLGYITGDAKWDLLRKAKAVIIPSVCYENFPVTALEGMAVATPVIAPILGSLPFIIEDKVTGLLFQPGDPLSLSQAINWLCEHPDESSALGLRGRQELEIKYTSRLHFQRLMEIYQEVLRS